MPAATLTVGNVEITAILDGDTSMPRAEVFGASGDRPPGGTGSLAARYPDEFTADAWHVRDRRRTAHPAQGLAHAHAHAHVA